MPGIMFQFPEYAVILGYRRCYQNTYIYLYHLSIGITEIYAFKCINKLNANKRKLYLKQSDISTCTIYSKYNIDT